MRLRKSMAVLAFCATSAGVSLVGAGTALAWHNEVYHKYASQAECQAHLQEVATKDGIGGAYCDPDGTMTVSVQD